MTRVYSFNVIISMVEQEDKYTSYLETSQGKVVGSDSFDSGAWTFTLEGLDDDDLSALRIIFRKYVVCATSRDIQPKLKLGQVVKVNIHLTDTEINPFITYKCTEMDNQGFNRGCLFMSPIDSFRFSIHESTTNHEFFRFSIHESTTNHEFESFMKEISKNPNIYATINITR